ncbi:MAG TPA: NAD(P)H-hydrate dehydratase [Blastocatellia bacterium]|nr:NAD(P)H-hydrate dehydratase [Blastocatellia bacterium]
MKKVLNAGQMREVDRLTTERYNIPGTLLMENAGQAVFSLLTKSFGDPSDLRVIVVCGRGNNGGDGAVVARQLWQRGSSVDLFLLGELNTTKGDARINFEIARKLSEEESNDVGQLSFTEVKTSNDWRTIYNVLEQYDLLVDAILGTGLNRPAEGLYGIIIKDLAEFCPIPILSVDLPSGLSADSALAFDPHIKADCTVTFTSPKPVNVLSPACFAGGELTIAPIGSPEDLIEASGSSLNLVERQDIAAYLTQSRRAPYSHKGAVGNVLVIAGSRGKTGAACMTAEAVLRSGAGLVTIASSASAQDVIAQRVIPEVMTEPLAETDRGSISHQALESAVELMDKVDVLAIGPGLSSAEESTRAFVREIINRRTVPVIIDADGLNSLSPWPGELKGSDELPLILTPHPGEMSRLTGLKTSEIQERPTEIARDFATAHSVFLVLKEARTIIASPDGQVYVNPTGNSGMSTAGAGDVLTGIIAGLLAQKTQLHLGAVLSSVYLHGLAGNIAAEKSGVRSLIATDITRSLSEAILTIGGDNEKP